MVDRTAITEMELLQIIVEMLKEEMKEYLTWRQCCKHLPPLQHWRICRLLCCTLPELLSSNPCLITWSSLYDDDTNIIMKMFWWSPPTCPWHPGSIHSCGSPSRLLSLNDKKVSLTFFTFMYLCYCNKIIACSMCAWSYLKLCGDYLFVWSIFKAGVKALWCTYIWFTIYSYIAI